MPTRPSLAAAIRFAIGAAIESLHAFLAWNVVLVVATSLVLVASTIVPASALVGIPLLAPLTCGLLRLAAVARRGGAVALRTALPGIRHRFRTKVGLAAAQTAVLLLAIVNLEVAPAMGGIVAGLSMAVGIYVGLAVLATATVGWTLLCDPRRESAPLGQLGRLTMLILLRRPLQVLFLLLLVALSATVIYNLVAFAMLLPSLVLLVITGWVIPIADELAGEPADDG